MTIWLILLIKKEYIKIRDFISSHNIDVAICDSLNHACVEASLSSQIPFLITTAIPGGEGKQRLFARKYIPGAYHNLTQIFLEYRSLSTLCQ